MSIYVASKSKHAPMWRALRAAGLPIVSTWIDVASEDEIDDWQVFWDRCIREAVIADSLIAYHEPGEEWKGAFVEIGAHLTKPFPSLLVVGNPPGSWRRHRSVDHFESIADAIEYVGHP